MGCEAQKKPEARKALNDKALAPVCVVSRAGICMRTRRCRRVLAQYVL